MENLDHIKNLILTKAPLDMLIKEHVDLKGPAGRMMGCCPFHSEKTPSFYVYQDHYHCFGCGAHGDAISFVRQQQGLGFLDALRWLADKFHVEVSFEQENTILKTWKKASENQKIMQQAQFFFRENLKKYGDQATEILKKRGFSREQIEQCGFGLALDQSRALTNFLRQQGFGLEQLVEMSLSSMGQGGVYDFFRHRIMLPIKDSQGKIIAFAGRALRDDAPQKYINSRYDKRRVLYGLFEGKEQIQKTGRAIVVEGYMDALKMHAHGFQETVACQGTALTPQHIDSLKGLTKRIYLLFDGDKAGQAASLRMISEAMKYPGITFLVCQLSGGEDPDSFLNKYGNQKMTEVLATAIDLLDFAIDQTLAESSTTSIPKVLTESIIPWLQTIEDPIQLSFLCQKVAQKAQISSEVLANQVMPKKNKARTRTSHAPVAERLSPMVFDILGAIYYASPTHVNTQEIRSLLAQIELPPLWETWALEMVICLENTMIPSQKNDGDWLGTHHEPIARFLDQLKQRRKAFDMPPNTNAIAKLKLIHERNTIKQTLSSLRKQATSVAFIPGQAPSAANLDILRELQALSTRLNELDLRLME